MKYHPAGLFVRLPGAWPLHIPLCAGCCAL